MQFPHLSLNTCSTGIFREPPRGEMRYVFLDPQQPKFGFKLEVQYMCMYNYVNVYVRTYVCDCLYKMSRCAWHTDAVATCTYSKPTMYAWVYARHVCVCVCVRACVRACVCVCACTHVN